MEPNEVIVKKISLGKDKSQMQLILSLCIPCGPYTTEEKLGV